MRITPLDIRKQEFRKAMRGLDAEEVYAFLSTVGDEYEAILNDNKAIRERLIELDDKVQEYRTMERTLRDTLLTAERVTVEAKDNARREGSLIIKEAQMEAERALRDIKSEAMKLRQEVTQLRGQRESYLGRMKVIAESLLKFIGSVEVDFRSEDEAFKDQIPSVDESARLAESSVLPDPQTENGDLFVDRDEPVADKSGGEKDNIIQPESTHVASVAGDESTEPGPPRKPETPGIPADLSEPSPIDTRYERELPPLPRETRDSEPGRTAEDLRAEAARNPEAALSDINTIIERMAEGQKAILGQSSESRADRADAPRPEQTPTAYPDPRPAARPAERPPASTEFEPMPAAPAGPIASEMPADEPPRALEASSDRPPRDPGRTPLPSSSATKPPRRARGDLERDVATAVKTAIQDKDRRPVPRADGKSKMPSGKEVTSEISLDQIRRDLERRMADEKENGQ